jgi:hypothetical protein
MTRYRARDVEQLRELVATPRRAVPHSIRSLAKRLKTNHSTVGYLLTGERPVVDEQVAKGFAEEYGLPLEVLFLPEANSSENENSEGSAA